MARTKQTARKSSGGPPASAEAAAALDEEVLRDPSLLLRLTERRVEEFVAGQKPGDRGYWRRYFRDKRMQYLASTRRRREERQLEEFVAISEARTARHRP